MNNTTHLSLDGLVAPQVHFQLFLFSLDVVLMLLLLLVLVLVVVLAVLMVVLVVVLVVVFSGVDPKPGYDGLIFSFLAPLFIPISLASNLAYQGPPPPFWDFQKSASCVHC